MSFKCNGLNENEALQKQKREALLPFFEKVFIVI